MLSVPFRAACFPVQLSVIPHIGLVQAHQQVVQGEVANQCYVSGLQPQRTLETVSACTSQKACGKSHRNGLQATCKTEGATDSAPHSGNFLTHQLPW